MDRNVTNLQIRKKNQKEPSVLMVSYDFSHKGGWAWGGGGREGERGIPAATVPCYSKN